MSEFSYSDRYGQVPTRWKPLAVTLLIIGGAWLLWAGLHHSRPAISASLISFSVSSDREVSIRYSLDRRDPSLPVTCTLVAHDFDKNVVGEVDALFPAGAAHIETITLIATRSASVNAGISRCWATTQ
ncbi:MAG: DUF4307 domain-containing protein [Actinobacteria bacterium]|uniref:Unannotated protein n=1 Tax=freshwater metagenome TaxID=449393 RepID=A0A6J7HEL6_9ZZZZ|nr:DUF4307 domain-containing protein [Actinomycetota bacterium]MSW47279.1 DUF4307 domain-containing protein [Actinomycetota bacterium]MSX24176.1 DUF4307 domain-containing protein [Actinomycetota bacterium]MSY57774.1 DUF4307 domain-containing protein [Actinomycetota bacterium]MTB00310.1 DUF4307 domain-containing protein [Actinomycetota bacterium]